MLDVEYLLAPPHSDRPIVYCYRTGILRPQMKSALRELAERDALLVYGCEPGDIMFATHASLLPGIAICDWSNEKTSIARALIPQALAALTTSEGCSVAIFVRYDDALCDHPDWPEAKARCLLVEEPLVTSETLSSALKYLEATSDLVDALNLVESSELQAYFKEVLEEQQSIGLPELIHRFDEFVLLNSRNQLGNRLTAGLQRSDRSATLRPLRELIACRSAYALPKLIRGLERKYRRGWTVRELTHELFRITQKLLDQSGMSARRSEAGNGATEEHDLAAIIWTAMLLGWTDRLLEQEAQLDSKPRPNLFLVTVDQLGRDFVRRCCPQMMGDPLAGLWPDLREAIVTSAPDGDETKTSKVKLVSEFAAYLSRPAARNPRWLMRLSGLLTTAADMSGQDLEAALPIVPSQSKLITLADPRTVADIVGHQSALQSLRNRIKSEAHGTAVVLYGPKGVGKRTLAHVYARGLLCEGGRETAPCGRCASCKLLEVGSFNLIELDAGDENALTLVWQQLQNLRYVPLFGHRIIIISNPERAPGVVDTLLKTLEIEFKSTTFLFLASSLTGLSATGQSRCAIFRLRPLGPYDARRLSEAFLRSAGFVCDDDRVLDLIVAEGGGLPGRLRELCERVLHAQASSLHDTRRALGLEWVEDAVSYWRALLGEENPPISALELPRVVCCSKATERVRLVLEQLQRFSSAKNGRIDLGAPFVHLKQSMTDLFHLLEQRAAERNVSTLKLASELGLHWTADEYADAAGFLGAGLKSREIILGVAGVDCCPG